MTASLEESRTDVLRTAAIAAAPPTTSTRARGSPGSAGRPHRGAGAKVVNNVAIGVSHTTVGVVIADNKFL